jgi:hypothetical protein
MSGDMSMVIVIDSEEVARALADDFRAAGAEIERMGSRRGIDGSAGEWVLFVTVGVQVFRVVASQLIAYTHEKRIAAIKLEGVEIQRPTKRQVDELIEFYIEQRRRDTDAT